MIGSSTNFLYLQLNNYKTVRDPWTAAHLLTQPTSLSNYPLPPTHVIDGVSSVVEVEV